jgi:hypothetical protein
MNERLFQPERLAMILSSLSSRRSEKADAVKSHSSQAIQIDPALLEQFGRSMRENFTSGSIPFRKAYLKSLIEVIEVDDIQIRIKGSKDVLERAVLASRNESIPGSQMSTGWRTRHDSNVHPNDAVYPPTALWPNERANPPVIRDGPDQTWTAGGPAPWPGRAFPQKTPKSSRQSDRDGE